MSSLKPRYIDIDPGCFEAAAAAFDYAEMKWDGLYAELVAGTDGWSIHSRSGQVLRYGFESCPECMIQGEYLGGTEWSRNHAKRGCFVAWNCCYMMRRPRLRPPETGYEAQRSACAELAELLPPSIRAIMPGLICEAKPESLEALWAQAMDEGWEGIVLRSADGQRFGRMKRTVTVDYVCSGYKSSGPAVTALYGALLIDGHLETVATVPVKSTVQKAALWAARKSLVGRVFEAKGNARHSSGALRHPRQAGARGAVKWRDDKPALECV